MKFVPFCPVYSSARLKREAGSHKNFKKSCEILRECRTFQIGHVERVIALHFNSMPLP